MDGGGSDFSSYHIMIIKTSSFQQKIEAYKKKKPHKNRYSIHRGKKKLTESVSEEAKTLDLLENTLNQLP